MSWRVFWGRLCYGWEITWHLDRYTDRYNRYKPQQLRVRVFSRAIFFKFCRDRYKPLHVDDGYGRLHF